MTDGGKNEKSQGRMEEINNYLIIEIVNLTTEKKGICVSTERTAVSTMKLSSASFSAKVRKRTVDQELDMYVMHRFLISSLQEDEKVYKAVKVSETKAEEM